MADPVSLAASIIALTHAAKVAIKACEKLSSLRHMSAAVCALGNEIVEVRLLVSRVDSLLVAHGQLNDRAQKLCFHQEDNVGSLQRHSDNLKQQLLDLENLKVYKLLGPNGEARKLQWLRFQSSVEQKQQNLRQAKLDLSSSLAVLTSEGNLRLQLQLEDIQIVIEESERRNTAQSAIHQEMLLSAISPLLEAQNRSEETFKRMEAIFQSIGFADKTPHNPPTGEKSGLFEIDEGRGNADLSLLPGSNTSFSTVNVRLSEMRPCKQRCPCRCHKPGYFKSPGFLKTTLGLLYGGYLSFPALKQSCDWPKICKGSAEGRLSVNYVFPKWFMSNVLSLAVRLTPVGTPDLSLRMMRVRQRTDDIFHFASDRYLDKMHDLLVSGKGSVIDITVEDGHTPLHVAVQGKQTEMVKLLLRHGAEPYLENYHKETSYEIAWDDILANQGVTNLAQSSRKARSLLECFPDAEPCQERRQFTKIHKIVLNMLCVDLEQELSIDRSAIDTPDADGRTPLYWACQRGDVQATAVLLKYDADPDKTDQLGQGPLRASIKNDNSDCLQALLNKGADPNIKDKWQQTCLIAANFYPRPTLFMPHLLRAGADVNAREDHGATALTYCVFGPNTKFFTPGYHPPREHRRAAELLLRHGADLNIQDGGGFTPLLHHIRDSAHLTVELFLRQHADYHLCTRDRKTVLHVAAEYADARTLMALAAGRMHGLNTEQRDKQGRTALEVAESRRTGKLKAWASPEEQTAWVAAWCQLLEHVRRPLPVATSALYAPELAELSNESDESWHTAVEEFALDLEAMAAPLQSQAPQPPR
ncbi:hypothetical protein F5Y14DRAFT_451966 [Nemania sp. NC0429]|nr:hypothetical protein F5Y14DRAFT_451966 [Nemania sp. NC0429]